MVDVFILGGIAVFVLYRLYRTLGEDDGPPEGRKRQTVVTPFPGPGSPDLGKPNPNNGDRKQKSRFTGPAAAGLAAIHAVDPSFEQHSFLSGAQHFYRMIVTAFQEGDVETLYPWLDDDVKEAWQADIESREEGYMPWTIRQLRFADIEAASLVDNIARIEVKFDTSLAKNGSTQRVKEVWTLMRDMTNEDPNWMLDDVEAVQ